MSKKVLLFLAVVITLAYLFDITSRVSNLFVNISNSIKNVYVETFVKSSNFISKYFDQANIIEELRKENQTLKEYKLLYEAVSTELENISNVVTWGKFDNIELHLTRVVSYKSPNDMSQVWIDYDLSPDKIVGLIFDNYAAGIAIVSENRTLALLNHNQKSNYGVIIGNERATGITYGGDEHGNILIRYIPLWQSFKVGDIVYTSGMDGIFYEGLMVGEIVSIKQEVNTFEATMKPYVKPSNKRYFYICDI